MSGECWKFHYFFIFLPLKNFIIIGSPNIYLGSGMSKQDSVKAFPTYPKMRKINIKQNKINNKKGLLSYIVEAGMKCVKYVLRQEWSVLSMCLRQEWSVLSVFETGRSMLSVYRGRNKCVKYVLGKN